MAGVIVPPRWGEKAKKAQQAIFRTSGGPKKAAEAEKLWRVQPVDVEVPRSVGIDPSYRKIVVIKSAVHYRASYEPIAAEIIEVDGPGLSSPNLSRFTFRHIRRPIFPIDKEVLWKLEE